MSILSRLLGDWGSAARYLYHISRGQRTRIALSCLCGVLEAFFSLAFVYASKLIIDVATGSHEGDWRTVALWTTLFLLIRISLSSFSTWFTRRMEIEVANGLRMQFFAHLLKSRWNVAEQYHSGDLINRVEADVNKVVQLVTTSIPETIVTAVRFLTAFILFCMLDSTLPWFTLILLVVCVPVGKYYSKKMRAFTRKIRAQESSVQAIIQENLQHRTVVKTLERDAWSLGKLEEIQQNLRSLIHQRTWFALYSNVMLSLAFWGSYLLAFIWGALRLKAGDITFGTMTAFIQLSGRLQRPAMDATRLAPSFIDVLTAIERLKEIEAMPVEENHRQIFFTEAPTLTMEDVSFAYDDEEGTVIDHLNLTFAPSSTTAIVGKTGAGKTTLIRLLLALITPQSGTISLHGKTADGRLTTVPLSAETRSNFVYVPQGNTLFSGTIRENLLMGKTDATEEEMREALRIAVADFIDFLPQGLDTRLGEKGGKLSEGQAQRIAIARALLRPGHILLFDEATSALDPRTEQQLLTNLSAARKGKTAIFITHHPELAKTCDTSFSFD